MNVAQLKKIINKLPDHMEVVVAQTSNDDFAFSLAESAKVKKVGFSENAGDTPMCSEKCLVITDEI